jgi:hypothetical protein
MIVIIGLGVVALLLAASQRGRSNSNKPAEVAAHHEPVPDAPAAHDLVPDSAAKTSGFRGVPLMAEPEPVDARELVKNLSEINLQATEITAEKAEQWHQDILKLVGQGAAAVPPLREFFQRNVDVRFDSGPGTNLLQEPTLRIAFLRVLFDIPRPLNVELQEQVLRTTTDPDEIALLARQLELQEPKTHRESIIEAASTALKRASNGQLSDRDTSPLVELLKKYEDTGVK